MLADVSILLAALALVVCWFSKRRAAKSDPMLALRPDGLGIGLAMGAGLPQAGRGA